MGLTGSQHCKKAMKNPDHLSVVTLTDSIVQRLPLDSENSSPLDREARQQNIDDFWKDRMECMDNAYMESLGLSEKSFDKIEKRILGMSPPIYKPRCSRNVEDLTTCVLVHQKDPIKCQNLVKKFLLCIDTLAEDQSRRSYLNAERNKKKKKCQ